MSSDQPPEPKGNAPDSPMRIYACQVRDGLAGDKYIFCLHTDRFYVYTKGMWQELFTIEMHGKISEALPDMNKWPISTQKQIIDHLKLMLRMHLKEFNWSELLNLKNGMLNPYNGTLEIHDPIFYSTLRMDYNFDEDATCELWTKTLMEILEENIDKINILQEFFGYCLTRETKMEKALLLLGESRSGKSTILHTLRGLVGEENCSSVPLKYISDKQSTAMLMNKIVNIDPDVSGKAEDFETEFKTITSGEPVLCSPKYITNFKFNPFVKLVMAANVFPRITDHSSAFYKRLILIPCNRVFEENEINRDLKIDLLKELPGILNWAIEGLKRMNKRKGFETHDFMREAVEELREESNPSEIFFKEHIEIIQGEEIEKGFLYDRYREWSKKSQPDGYVLSKAKFGASVYQKYFKSTPQNTMNHATNKRIWRNLKYIDNKDAVKPEQVSWQE